MNNDDVYKKLTDGIIRQLSEGIVPWKKPWQEMANLNTGRGYHGMNRVILACASEQSGYKSPYWTTFKGAQELGGIVRKGSHATFVSLWKELPRKGKDGSPEIDAPSAKKAKDTYLFCQYYAVFNLDQIGGITPEKLPAHVREREATKENRDPITTAEEIIAKMPKKPPIIHGGIAACYIPSADVIHLPPPEHFSSRAEYYATAYHELAHSTGHPSRLDRPEIQSSRFGSENYSKEELIAEFASNMLLSQSGIYHQKQFDNSASYCAGWLSALKNDRTMLMGAGAAAGKVSDYICNRSQEKVLENSKEKGKELVPIVSIPVPKPEPELALALNGRSAIAKSTEEQMGLSL